MADCVQIQNLPTWPPGAIFSRLRWATFKRVIPENIQTYLDGQHSKVKASILVLKDEVHVYMVPAETFW